MRGLCVGGDMAILFFGDFARHGEYFCNPKIQNGIGKNWISENFRKKLKSSKMYHIY